MGEAQDPGPGSQRRVRRISDDYSEDALIREGESPEVPCPPERRTVSMVPVVDGGESVGKVHDLTLPTTTPPLLSQDQHLHRDHHEGLCWSLDQLKPLRNRSKTEEVWRHRPLNPTSFCVLAPGKAPEAAVAESFGRWSTIPDSPSAFHCERWGCHNHESPILDGGR